MAHNAVPANGPDACKATETDSRDSGRAPQALPAGIRRATVPVIAVRTNLNTPSQAGRAAGPMTQSRSRVSTPARAHETHDLDSGAGPSALPARIGVLA
jgi:hypothetical protein